MQQDQAAHFAQWKRAAGGRPTNNYQWGATEGDYTVWKQTLDDAVESAWARHQDHAHREAARRQQLLVEQAAHARIAAAHRQQLLDEQAAARAHQEAAAAHARQEAARRQQILEDQAEAGRKYATRLFAQCVAEDHAAGLLYAKCLFNRCADTD
jgi:hypothetical protein